MYSTTKYIGGHGTSIGGVVIDGGNFPWDQHKDRQPLLNTPDPSYHGAVWAKPRNRSGRSPTSCACAWFCCAISARR